jgi:hypothetical protein
MVFTMGELLLLTFLSLLITMSTFDSADNEMMVVVVVMTNINTNELNNTIIIKSQERYQVPVVWVSVVVGATEEKCYRLKKIDKNYLHVK